jgi:hypothetical protein
LFIGGGNGGSERTEELTPAHSLYGSTEGKDIFKEVENRIAKYNFQWMQLKRVTTGGGCSICGT